MARKMGSSDGIESIGALFGPALAGEEIARIRSKIRLRASEPMLSPAVSSSISSVSIVSSTSWSVLSWFQSFGE
jgi:hypothetical protein